MSGLEELRRAARALQRERTIATLARAFAEIASPDSRFRTRLAREHGVFSPEAIERGTAEAVRAWDEACMRGLCSRELPARFRGPELTVVWLAGPIPTASFAALALPLLCGSAVYAKAASADRVSPRMFAELCAELDPGTARAIRVSDGRDRTGDLQALRTADAVVAHGSDATILALGRELSPHQLFAPHGHRVSVAAVGPELPVEAAAERAAHDLALWDGRGCLSPAWIFAIDRPRGRAAELARVLYGELEQLARKLPRGALDAREEAALRDWRARGSMREGVRAWLSEPGTEQGVLLDAHAPEPGTLRNVAVVPLAALDELAGRCAALRPHLSTIAHAGFGAAQPALETIALRAGASRLCPLGRMQLPPLDWSHDGLGALRPLVRALDVEREP